MRIEHIGIAVNDLSKSVPLFERLLNSQCYKTEAVPSEQVTTAFFQVGPNKIELLSGSSPESPISTFLQKRGEGIHHIAFEVEDIEAEMERLKAEGFQLLSDTPKPGADNKLICFLHPKSTNGVLVELCMEKKDR